jgi:colanic acid/amylovoran biosynthesis glycosyltransferase
MVVRFWHKAMAVNSRPRIVICAYDTADGKVGGPIAWMIDFVQFMRRMDVDVTVLILKPKGGDPGQIAAACDSCATPFDILDITEATFIEDQVEWILTQCRRRAPAVVVANLVLPAMLAARFLRPAGIKTVSVIHSDPHHDPFYRDVVNLLVASETLCPDIVVSVARFIDKEICKVTTNRKIRREVIACGCRSTSQFVSVPKEQLNLVYAGRLADKQKRIRETTEALLRVSAQPGVSAAICGDGPEKAWVVERLKGQDRVNYLGQLPGEELVGVMSRSHVLVLLSDFEGLPIALVEGMATGLVPVCLDRINGIEEVITNGVNGLLVSDRDGAFDEAISLLRTPGYWTTLSNAARQTVQQHFTHSVTFNKWLNLLSSPPESTIDPCKIVSHPRLPRVDRHFDYPQHRPTRSQRIEVWLRERTMAIRTAIRPRKRLNAFLQCFRKLYVR